MLVALIDIDHPSLCLRVTNGKKILYTFAKPNVDRVYSVDNNHTHSGSNYNPFKTERG